MTGQMIIYFGIVVASISFIGLIVTTVIFQKNKKQTIQQIYDSYDQ